MNTDAELLSGSDEVLVTPNASSRRGWIGGVLVGAAGMAALMGTASVAKSAYLSRASELQVKEERINIKPSFAACSSSKEDCSQTACCQVSGHTCYKKKNGKAFCNKTCTPGKAGATCEVLGGQSVPAASPLGQSLYCFAVYTHETGSPKPSFELELLQAQWKHGASLFGCDQWDVFSDASAAISDDYQTKKVEDTFGEFHQVKRKVTKSWVNWGLFYQVWVQIREVGKWESADWTVKVDADAVFLPQRLREYLGAYPADSPHGLYFENCPNVQYGFFGHLEVISRTGAETLTKYLENCHAEFAPCANDGCDWMYGAWGEDVFAQRCMDHHYVDKVEGFDMTTDGACETDRPKGEKKNKKWHATDCSAVDTVTAHPYKKVNEYFKCLGEMTGKTYTEAKA